MERDFKTLGIIIRKENRGERNSLVTLLTPDSGLVEALSFGGGRGSSSFRIPLYGEGVFSLERKNGNAVYLKDSDIISEHEWVKDSMEGIAWAGLMSELVIKARVVDNAVYRLYTSVLDRMEGEDGGKCAVYFLSHFLLLQGLSGDWESCPSCGREYTDGDILGFSTITGTAVCSSCDTLSSALILPPNARSYVMWVTRSDIDTALGYNISPGALSRIRSYLVRTLRYAFPARLKSLESGLIS